MIEDRYLEVRSNFEATGSMGETDGDWCLGMIDFQRAELEEAIQTLERERQQYDSQTRRLRVGLAMKKGAIIGLEADGNELRAELAASYSAKDIAAKMEQINSLRADLMACKSTASDAVDGLQAELARIQSPAFLEMIELAKGLNVDRIRREIVAAADKMMEECACDNVGYIHDFLSEYARGLS